MPNPVLILHGWSDNYESFQPLARWFERQGRPVGQLFLGNYESMQDDVTFDDLADGFQTRFAKLAERFDPFCLDVVVHSTGGPVFRRWLDLHLTEFCKNDLERCPVRSVIMLAPANFGSRLAAQGKSALAKLFRGGVKHGFQTGKRVLEGLELGSPDLWRIAEGDLFSKDLFYPCLPDKGPFVFVLSGTDTYGDLKGLVARGANENGSDGTVRASAASLNAVKLVADYRDPENPHVRSLQVPKQRFAFGLVPGVNHSGIVPDNPAKDAHPTLLRLRQCLQVTTGEQYQALCERWEEDNRRFYAAEREKAEGERVAPHQQFLVRVRDDMGNAVDDYRLDFHVVDPTIRTSAWADNPDVLVGLQRYQRYTERLGEEVIVDVQPHSVHQTHRAFYVNIDALEQLKADLAREQPDAYIAMNLDASGPTADLTYDTDRLQYLEVEPKGSGRPPFFRANTSTLVEIVLQRVPGEKIFVFHQLQG